MSEVDPRLLAAVGAPGLRWIWDRLHARLLRGQACTGVLRLQAPSEDEREAYVRLFGRAPRGEALAVDLEALETLLREAGLAGSLAEAARAVLGVDASAVRRQQEAAGAAWREVLEDVARRAGAAAPAAAQVLREAERTGLLQRLSERSAARARVLADGLLKLGDLLPARATPLARLAAKVAGDAHALDAGQPLGTLGLRLAALLAQLPPSDDDDNRREAWARVGVLCDELSAPVLALNLRATGASALDELISAHTRTAEPMRISVRQLLRAQPALELALRQNVFICENPAVLATAADELGTAAPPMVCTEGMPKTAANLLLGALTRAGGQLHFHADFDWAGIRIGNLLQARHGAMPWKMELEDYQAAAAGPALLAGPVAAGWSSNLHAGMEARGVAVHEESVLDVLLGELQAHGGLPP